MLPQIGASGPCHTRVQVQPASYPLCHNPYSSSLFYLSHERLYLVCTVTSETNITPQNSWQRGGVCIAVGSSNVVHGDIHLFHPSYVLHPTVEGGLQNEHTDKRVGLYIFENLGRSVRPYQGTSAGTWIVQNILVSKPATLGPCRYGFPSRSYSFGVPVGQTLTTYPCTLRHMPTRAALATINIITAVEDSSTILVVPAVNPRSAP